MLKIDAASNAADHVTITLTGNLLAEYLPEIAQAVSAAGRSGRSVSFDLSHVGLVDRSAVHFFARGGGRQARIVGCPGYLREWLKSEGRPGPEGM